MPYCENHPSSITEITSTNGKPCAMIEFLIHASDREKFKLQVSSCHEESIKNNISNVKKRFFGIPPDKKERMCYRRSRALRMSCFTSRYRDNTSTDIYIQYRMFNAEHHSDLSEIITAPIFTAVCGGNRVLRNV